jgi:predicted RND superfamily exporter protein
MQEGMSVGEREDAEVHVVRDIGPALVLCMLTSSIAFLSFLPTDYLGLGELGVVSAGGMVIALLLTLTLLPAFYSLTGLPLPPRRRAGQGNRFRAARLRPAVVLWLAVVVAAIAAWTARDLAFDYSVLALRDAGTEAMSTLLELQDNGQSTDYSIQLLGRDADSTAALIHRLVALPEVGAVIAPSSLVPAEQAEKAAMLMELQALVETLPTLEPADPGTAAQDLTAALAYVDEVRTESGFKPSVGDEALVEGFFRSLADLRHRPADVQRLNLALKDGLESELGDLRRISAARPFTFPDLPEDLRRRFRAADGSNLVTVLPEGAIDTRSAMDAFVQSVLAVHPEIGGRAVVEWGVGGVAVTSFVQAVTIAIAAITLFLVVYFRGVLLPVVVLVPLALATLVTFAIVQLTGLTLNMANILVVPLIFGLGVDTGIHVVHRFSTAGDVARMMTSSTTRAVIISGLTTIGTFFSLSFSPHKGAASVGMLLTIAISTMLIATLVVVPALLRQLSGRIEAER